MSQNRTGTALTFPTLPALFLFTLVLSPTLAGESLDKARHEMETGNK